MPDGAAWRRNSWGLRLGQLIESISFSRYRHQLCRHRLGVAVFCFVLGAASDLPTRLQVLGARDLLGSRSALETLSAAISSRYGSLNNQKCLLKLHLIVFGLAGAKRSQAQKPTLKNINNLVYLNDRSMKYI